MFNGEGPTGNDQQMKRSSGLLRTTLVSARASSPLILLLLISAARVEQDLMFLFPTPVLHDKLF